MATKIFIPKTYGDCILYNKYPAYNKVLMDGILSTSIDKGVDEVDDIVYEIKRTRVNKNLLKVLTSPKTILIRPEKPMPKPFVVFVAKDPKAKNERHLFIDVSNCISTSSKGGYIVNSTRLISHLISGWSNMAYSAGQINPHSANKLESAATCFAKLFTHVIDYVGKISVVADARDKCMYLSTRYFFENLAQMNEDRSREIARKKVGWSEAKEGTMDYMLVSNKKDNPFANIRMFAHLMHETFKLEKLNLDGLVETWMYLYGPGTVFAIEYLPALMTMLTDAYTGGFINNQKTIEKICGKDMIDFSKSLIDQI